MKKNFILLLLILLCTTFFPACNDYESRLTLIEETDVAKLSLVTFDGKNESVFGLKNLGHAFLILENISDSDIQLNNITLSPDKAITIGTWSIKEHFGVWYNVESNYIAEHNKYDGRISISIGIDEEDISTISKEILDRDRWGALHNCSNFALNVFNSVALPSEEINNPVIYSPSYLAKEIKKFDNYQVNIPVKTEKKFGYFKDATYVSFMFDGVEV